MQHNLRLLLLSMRALFNSSWQLGTLSLPNRLIQGPLAGVSSAPFRQLFYRFTAPAYCVSEMLSAHDVVHKHQANGRYLYRAAEETRLAYQIAGTDPILMAEAAVKLVALGADIIDINCGCPKLKIRKKGAGSALLEQPQRILAIIRAIKNQVHCPLTIKIRLQNPDADIRLAQSIADEGADALIIHGRRWQEDYAIPCDWQQIANIKQALTIPVIVNGDIADRVSLQQALQQTDGDAYMISRAGTGKPWLYEELLSERPIASLDLTKSLFLSHIQALAHLESEYQAVQQSKSLVKYYFRDSLSTEHLQEYYTLNSLPTVAAWLCRLGHCH